MLTKINDNYYVDLSSIRSLYRLSNGNCYLQPHDGVDQLISPEQYNAMSEIIDKHAAQMEMFKIVEWGNANDEDTN